MSVLLKQAEFAQNQASHPETSVWVAASAGTGKTKVLTDRLLRLLLEGNEPHRILCLTFTKAAAAEMANRLHKKLSSWATLEDSELTLEIQNLQKSSVTKEILQRARTLFTYVLDTPGGLKIQTIHGFCQVLLKRFPLEANLPPHFEVLDEQASRDLMHQAQINVLNKAHKSAEEEEAIAVIAQQFDANTFSSLLKEMERFGELPASSKSTITLRQVVNFSSKRQVPQLKQAANSLLTGSSTDQERGKKILKWLQLSSPQESDFLEYAQTFLTKTNGIRKKLCTIDLIEKNPELDQILSQEAERVEQVVTHLNMQKIQLISDSLKLIGSSILRHYKNLKLKNSFLDYDDLITKTVQLLSQPEVAPWVLYKLDGGLDHILVDEAQDTSPSQWRVISALAEEFFHNTQSEIARTLFVVGDAKQSIYSFQGAEPESFSAMGERFSQFSKELKRTWSEVDLNISFRSSKAVLEVVDHVFKSQELQASLLHHGQVLKHHAFRKDHAGLVEIWPLMKSEEKEVSDIWELPVQDYTSVQDPSAQTADLIAERIQKMLANKEILKSKGRPIRASDILILVQRRGSFVPKLIKSLKHKNISVAGSDRMVLTDQLVVKDLIALGEFFLLPDDDLTLATVLKSPLFNLTDADLLALCPNRVGSLWSVLLKSEVHATITGTLKHLLNLQDTIRPYELYMEVLNSIGGKKNFLRRLGPECLDPLEEFLNQILAFEQTHTPTLQNFIHYMQKSQVEIKRDFEQGVRDEVRVMTVHGSKGLQAPIVILPDTIRTPNKPEKFLSSGDDFLWSPPQVKDTPQTRDLKSKAQAKQMEEYWRLLYVAMTRAEDRLYVCGWETKKPSDTLNWYSAIASSLQELGIYNEERQAWVYETEQLTPVDQVFEKVSQVDVGASPHWLSAKTKPEKDPFQWVTPSTLDENLIVKDKNYKHSPEYAAHRGTLIHKLLENPPPSGKERSLVVENYLRHPAHKLKEIQVSEIKTHVLRVFESEAFKSISGGHSQVEIPIVGKLNDQYISAQIDRLVEEETYVLIIDYKTNEYPPKNETEIPQGYLKQMSIYEDLLKPLYPGKIIKSALFWTETCELMYLGKPF